MIDSKKFRDIDPGQRVLMGPGPSGVPSRVLQAMAAPCIGHLDPYFLSIMDETQHLLRFLFQTENALTIPVSGTGSAGMETCFVNLVEPGDEVVVCVNGVFGTRMCDIVTRIGGTLIRVDAEWGQTIDPEAVRKAVDGKSPKLLAVVHAETSTGVCQPLEELSEIAKAHGALFLVDMVTSLGGMNVAIDEMEIDAAYSGTQKCLSCPPGLSPVSFSAAAMEALKRRKSPVVSWYLDMSMVKNYWAAERKYHHTAPINMIYGLREALRIIAEEGLEERFARHRLHHHALVAGIEAITGPQDESLKMMAEFKARRDLIVDGLNEIPGFSCLRPKGAFYVFPNITGTGRKSKELEEFLLEEAGVAGLSGTSFGKYGEGYLRFSYANSQENIRKALEKIKKVI